MAHSDEPRLNWTAANLSEIFQLFKQRCQIYFDIKDIKEEKQVSHILFFTGDKGLRRYNSWGLADMDKSKPKVVWEHFEKVIVKHSENLCVARLYLRRYKQQEKDSNNNLTARCKIQAIRCSFCDEFSKRIRIIEQIIDGTHHTEVQKELLGKPKTLTLEEVLDEGRKHEASVSHMKHIKTDVHLIKKSQQMFLFLNNKCKFCGRNHPWGKDNCPARDTVCFTCSQIHAGRQGSTKCKDSAQTCVFWEKINKDIDDMVRKCQICTEYSFS